METLPIAVFSWNLSISDTHIASDVGLAYLLGDKAIITGGIKSYIRLMAPGAIKNILAKVDVLIAFYARNSEMLASLQEIKKYLIEGGKIKIRSRQTIIAMENMKRTVDTAYENEIKHLAETDHWKKYTQLGQLVKDQHLVAMPSAFSDSELDSEKEGYIPLSWVFLNKLHKRECPYPDYFFFISHHVLNQSVRNRVAETAPENVEYTNLEPIFLFRIPDVMLLSPLELVHLRRELKSVLDPVREVFRLLYEKLDRGEDGEACYRRAGDMLESLTPLLQDAINSHLFIRKLIAADPTLAYYDVCLGLVNKEEIWQLYHALGEVSEETRVILESHVAPPEQKYVLRPYLMARPNLGKNPFEFVKGKPLWMQQKEPVLPKEEIPTKRKILNL